MGSLSYYGVMLHAYNLCGNLLLNFTLLVAAEFPAKICDITCIDCIGRKRLYVALMVLGGVANISTIGPMLYGFNGNYLQSVKTIGLLIDCYCEISKLIHI